MIRQFAILLVLGCFSFNLSWGQRTTGTISGIVTDTAGAMIPGSNVTALEVSTGTTTQAQTNETGSYILTNLAPGTYRLQIGKPGFKTYVQQGVVLLVDRPITINVQLNVGEISQQVTVNASAATVELSSPTVSYTVTAQMATQLPLNGRDVLQLMTLAPDAGPTYSPGYQQSASRPESNVYVGASGGIGDSTTFYLDGTLNEDPLTNIANIYPNPDAIQEFSFETSTYSAKFGGRGGGLMNAATKSGTNQYHGDAYEFFRYYSLNARNFFSSTTDGLKRNQWGGTIGGPIQKDKTFFFFSYEGTALREIPTENVAFTPTAAELQGNFSAINKQLVNPTTQQPFPGNQIPTSLFNPIAMKLLSLVPTGAPGTGETLYPTKVQEDDKQFVTRIDHNFGDKFRIFGSYLYDGLTEPNLSIAGDVLSAEPSQYWRSQNLVLSGTYDFSSNLVTTIAGSISRRYNVYAGPSQFPGWAGLGVNVPDMVTGGPKQALNLTVGGYFSLNWDGLYTLPATAGDIVNNWAYTVGRHTFEFGGELIKNKVVYHQDYLSNGDFSFSDALSGNNLADFMLGKPTEFIQLLPIYFVAENTLPALYANDTWKVTRRLTVTLGLRWNPFVPMRDTAYHQASAYFVQSAYNNNVHSQAYPNLPPGLFVWGDPGVPAGGISTISALFDPRVGVAYDPFGDGKTSIRAGYGMYQDQMTTNQLSGIDFTPFSVRADILFPSSLSNPYAGQVDPFPLSQPVPSNISVALPMASAAFAPGFPAPTIEQWNFTIERQSPWGILLHAGYEGSHASHVLSAVEANAAVYNPNLTPAQNLATTNARRPMGAYFQSLSLGTNPAMSNFDALVVSAQKTLSNDLTFLAGYRWSKCLNEGWYSFYYEPMFSSPTPRFDYGACDYDVASQLHASYVYRLPTPNMLGFVGRKLLGGWETTGILTVQSGLPFSVLSGVDNSFSGIGMDRADIIGSPYLSGNRSTAEKLNEWFNTQAFVVNAYGTYGDTGRNILRGPGLTNLDFSLVRSFPISLREGSHLDFRAEAFNIFNHPNFSNPNATVVGPSFGQITSAGSPRILQFALKYVF